MKIFRRKASAPVADHVSDSTDDPVNTTTEKTAPDGLAPADPPRGPSVAEVNLRKFEQLHEYDPNLPGNLFSLLSNSPF